MLIPYPELKLSLDEKQSLLILETPWLSLDIEIDNDKQSWIKKIISDIERKNYPNLDIHTFLENLADFPLAIQQPRKNLTLKANRNDSLNKISSIPTDKCRFKDFIDDCFIQETRQSCPFISSSLPQHTTWEFDLDFIKKHAAIPETDLYDPISAFHLIRRERLLHELRINAKHKLIDKVLPNLLEEKRYEEFKQIIIHLLRLNHFVTANCAISIEPSLTAFPFIAEAIKEFLRNEKGHDRLLALSLAKLTDVNPRDLPVYMESVSAMASLYFSAKYSVFSLLNIIEAFEGVAYEDMDPLVELVKKSPWPDAAIGIEKHFIINKKGEHNMFAINLINVLEPLSVEELNIAVHLAEICSESDNKIVEIFLASI